MKNNITAKFKIPKDVEKILKMVFPFVAFALIISGLVLIVLKIISYF